MGSRRQSLAWLTGSLIAACILVAAAGRAQAADDSSPRPYSAGPLTAADYQQAVPNPRPVAHGVWLVASTWTGTRYTTTYDWHELGPRNVEARLTKMRIVAQVDRAKSWNSDPNLKKLMDHEQGHFDITEIYALRAQKKFDDQMASPGIVGYGKDEKTAVADLEQRVKQLMDDYLDGERTAQVDYDKVTQHGMLPGPQSEQRSFQQAALQELLPAAGAKAKDKSR